MRDDKPRFPALVTIVREGLGLDRDTFKAIDDALASEWESIGMRALKLHDLADVALVIRELRYAGNGTYLSPSERVRRVWDAHTKHFRTLQRRYVAQLQADVDVLARDLGSTVHRATLWLANARGKLARWASEGALYAGARQLKLVPTGHDSPWIAGEAIGSEEVKIKDVKRTPGVHPTWRSVLAIPIFAGDGSHPDFAAGVLTFGLSKTSSTLLARQDEWHQAASALSAAWGTRISEVAFST
ncbi:hypothetical protein GCM10022240_04190 [Microbacterium kribbense]|uniref:GAF domain-containing protein n=2 Tax=Microbacterium kribbense TaxID=433645 RepID=A0ABP7G3S5_9MICO